MNDNIFREYDIRGIVGEQIYLTEIDDLTKAILSYFLLQNPKLSKIVIGMDGRTHSPAIKKQVITTATSLGLNVTDIGLCPTPVFYFSLFNTPATSGLMITASHNPKEYNGIKICHEKKSVWGHEIQTIKDIYKTKKFVSRNTKLGTVTTYDALGEYTSWLCHHFSHLQGKDINAVIDCGNGTAGTVFPNLINKMGWKNTKLLFEEVDGTFPNHDADPTEPKNMQEVKKLLGSYSIGIGLDGDCDRMNPMTKSGYLVPGDKLLAIYSKKIVKDFPGASIVFDVKSSNGLVEELTLLGAKPCMAPSGHSIIKDHLRKNKAKLAGELSCHFFFNDRYFGYDDGIYAALRLFELLEENYKTFDELINELPKKVSSPEYRLTCTEQEKAQIVEHVKTIFAARKDTQLLTIDGMRAQTPYGWGLIRASNTQSVICLRFESETQEGLQQIIIDFSEALTPYYEKKFLKAHLDH